MSKPLGNTALTIFSAVTIQRFLTAFIADMNTIGSLEPESIEAVHRMRVAGRRLRNALDILGAQIAPKRSVAWRKEIRKLTSALSLARDLDVQIDYVKHFAQSVSPVEKPGVRRLILRLTQERQKTQTEILKGLKALNKSGTVSEILQRVESLLPLEMYIDLTSPALREVGSTAIVERLNILLENDEVVYQVENLTGLHAMRILAKHLRYTLEIFDPVFENSLAPTIKITRQMQDALGSLHDYDVWSAQLEEFIEKERQRTVEYFGSQRPFRRLTPGLEAYRVHCQQKRDDVYAQFVKDWEEWKNQSVWENLRIRLLTPAKSPLLNPTDADELESA